MRKYVCSCGIILNSLGAIRNHLKYHKKYDPCHIIYRLKWWHKAVWTVLKHGEKIIKFIALMMIFQTIVFHDNTYNWLERALIFSGIGLLI